MTPIELLLLASLNLFFQPHRVSEPFDVIAFKTELMHTQARETRLWSMLNQKNPFHSEFNPNTNLSIPIEDPHAITAIINRLHVLAQDFVPNDLVDLNTLDSTHPSRIVSYPAAKAFLALREAVLSEIGIRIDVRSGYRSFVDQQRLFNSYAQRDGVLQANRYSAFAGQSEHQSGLALDIAEHTQSFLRFGESKAYAFLLKHAHTYGFILRYPPNTAHITGYIYEPWHWRYVGVELASALFEHNKTLDEHWIEGLR